MTEEQAIEIAQNVQVFWDRIGMVLIGAKRIAAYMGVSPATIVRWRKRFRGREEFRLCFPAVLFPTGKGWGWRLVSHTALIKEWMERWWQIDCASAQGKAKWRRRTPRTKRIGETRKPPAGQFGRQTEPSIHERQTPVIPLREELEKIGPNERAWVINHELTPELGEIPAHTKKCTCGTEIPCTAHD